MDICTGGGWFCTGGGDGGWFCSGGGGGGDVGDGNRFSFVFNLLTTIFCLESWTVEGTVRPALKERNTFIILKKQKKSTDIFVYLYLQCVECFH